MATINAKILNRTDRKGLTRVQIAIQHKGELAYISTDIKVKPEDFLNGRVVNGPKRNAVNAKIIELENTYRERLEEEDNLPAINVIQLKEHLTHERIKKFTTVCEAFDIIAAKKDGKSNHDKFLCGKAMFLRFNKGRDITIKSIDRDTVLAYRKWLDTAKAERTGKLYSEAYKLSMMSYLKILINESIKAGLVKYDVHPFDGVKVYNGDCVRDNCISVDTLNLIRNYKPERASHKVARDLFLLSFYLGGMNLIDMLSIDFRKDRITYVRQKIRTRVSESMKTTIPILPEARGIIDNYIKEDGRLNIDRYKGGDDYRTLVGRIDRMLKKIKLDYSLDEDMTFYSARKCFAQVAMNIGISDNIIDYILGHTPSKRGVIAHYSSVMPELAEEAMKMVFEFIDKPEDIKAIFRKNILKQLNG